MIFSDIEREILETALRNPELSNSEIADRTGARLTLVRDTRRTYEDEVELSEAAAEAAEAADTAEPPAGVDDDLSEAQVAILNALQADPTLSNAEVAEETGARIALVRDTRAEYGEPVTAAESATEDDTDDADTDSTDTDDGPSEAQAAILGLVADEPELSNAEIADRTGSRITLVRDTLREYSTDDIADTDTTSDAGGSANTGSTPEVDTEAFSPTQVEIIETALEDPELTNAEIADETDTRITLVRDTISAYESDGDGSDTTESGEADTESDTGDGSDTVDVLADVDTDAFSATQLDILETALRNPELTNAEIAEETETRITLVRDTLFDYEYDEKPWAGDVDEGDDDDGESDEESVTESTPTTDEPELPETTASDLLSTAEREILETALEDPELTNAEIADRTGTRITLVRDTRQTYEDAVDLAEPTDDAEASETSAGSEPEKLPETTDSDLLSDAERAILETALDDPERTNAEIADETGTRITLVRDTRRTYEDAVDRADDDERADAAAADSTERTDDAAETADSTDPASGSEGGVNTGLIVLLLIGLLLVIVLAVSVL
ncbi:MAG: hypothetical protein R6V31_07970 [Halohasta sp.]